MKPTVETLQTYHALLTDADHEVNGMNILPVGDGVDTAHWLACIFYCMSKAAPWRWDLRAFKTAMLHTAAICIRAAIWTDETLVARAAAVAASTAAHRAQKGEADGA